VKLSDISGVGGGQVIRRKDKINVYVMYVIYVSILVLHRGKKKDYQTRNDFINDEKFDLPADSHNIVNRQKNHFRPWLNV
jgi:hypothetical protein